MKRKRKKALRVTRLPYAIQVIDLYLRAFHLETRKIPKSILIAPELHEQLSQEMAYIDKVLSDVIPQWCPLPPTDDPRWETVMVGTLTGLESPEVA